jgi:hypothetical protein
VKIPILSQLIRRIQPETLIDKTARFVACEMIEGDYLEFGVYQGAAFISAYHAFREQFEDRVNLQIGGKDQQASRARRQDLWNSMRFFAFDSFAGLPTLADEDTSTADFEQGQFAFPASEFRNRLKKGRVPLDRVRVVEGWFEATCTEQTRKTHDLTRAAVVWIDADLYSSARTALEFITPLIQDGTVIIFDDWYSYRGNPKEGEQRAFQEWQETIRDRFSVQEYQKESWKRNSFIISAR